MRKSEKSPKKWNCYYDLFSNSVGHSCVYVPFRCFVNSVNRGSKTVWSLLGSGIIITVTMFSHSESIESPNVFGLAIGTIVIVCFCIVYWVCWCSRKRCLPCFVKPNLSKFNMFLLLISTLTILTKMIVISLLIHPEWSSLKNNKFESVWLMLCKVLTRFEKKFYVCFLGGDFLKIFLQLFFELEHQSYKFKFLFQFCFLRMDQ